MKFVKYVCQAVPKTACYTISDGNSAGDSNAITPASISESELEVLATLLFICSMYA